MNKCLVCEEYTVKWQGEIGICDNCGASYTKESYTAKKQVKDASKTRLVQFLNEVKQYYGMAFEVNRLKEELSVLTSKYTEIEAAIESGHLKTGHIIEIEGDLKTVVKTLLSNYNPPEIFTAAYKVRSSLENWLKYELNFDLNGSLYPTGWEQRKKIFFKDFPLEFADSFLQIYRTMNIFVHQNLEDLFKKSIITTEQKMEAIQLGVDFIDKNQLYVKDELKGRERLLIKNDSLILAKMEQFFSKYENVVFEDKKAYSKFKKDLSEIRILVDNQTALLKYLLGNKYKVSTRIHSTFQDFRKIWVDKYHLDVIKGMLLVENKGD